MTATTIREWIAELMRERGMSQSELGRSIGRSQSTISKWLRGDVPMTLEDVEAVAGALELPVEHLLRGGA